MGHSKCSPERKVDSHECIYQKHRKISISDLILHLKLLEKIPKNKTQKQEEGEK
jgi:hypothetical protein